jgi:DNA-directed RNA polymerase subunit omega
MPSLLRRSWKDVCLGIDPRIRPKEMNVARITVEDCLKRVNSRFRLVHMAARRVRQIREGSEYLVSSPKNEDIVVALREIAAGKVTDTAEIDNEA